ncbi:MAG TPA: RHS repeat domain-containing protein [Verrucomicrobiae bacterium]|nr:RHS repeat domain-containing protein [Verrucomicrobiae bacterium]
MDATSTEIFRYSYDSNGRLTNRWTAAKGNTVYRYDLLGNLTNVDYAVSPDLTTQYDAHVISRVKTTHFSRVQNVANFFAVVKTAELASHDFRYFARAPIVFCGRITALGS